MEIKTEADLIRTEADLHQLIGTLESTYLEFKRGDVFLSPKIKEDIAKDISAFANADGGTIIYGIEEKNHLAEQIFPCNGRIITKDWLNQVVNSTIARRIKGVNYKEILINGKIEETVWIVEVPRSIDAPHQVIKTKKFHKRHGTIILEMEEFEIRDLYHRANLTNLEIQELRIQSKQLSFDESEYEIFFNVKNIGVGYEPHYKMKIETELKFDGLDNLISEYYTTDNGRQIFVYVIPNQCPIFQEEETKVISGRVTLNREKYGLFSGGKIIVTLYYSSGSKSKEFPFKRLPKYYVS